MKITVIGAGAMGGAIARGLVESGAFSPSDITVSNPSPARLEPLAALGINVTSDNVAAVSAASCVIVAVKPWNLPGVAAEILPALPAGCTDLCCVVAGVSAADLSAMFPGPYSLTIAMPNTAVALRKSMTFLVAARGEASRIDSLFACLGTSRVIPERLLPGAMALASCGIAYALRYVRAASEGGVQLGFRASEAQEIVAATLEGACALLSLPGAHAEAEIDKVTTPGGLTIRGLNAMERAGFTSAVIDGLIASASV